MENKIDYKYDAKIIAKFCKSYEAMERFRRAYEMHPNDFTKTNYVNSIDKLSIITPEEILKELGTSKEDLSKKSAEIIPYKERR